MVDTLQMFAIAEAGFLSGRWNHLPWEGDPDTGWAPKAEPNPGAVMRNYRKEPLVKCEWCERWLCKEDENRHRLECELNPTKPDAEVIPPEVNFFDESDEPEAKPVRPPWKDQIGDTKVQVAVEDPRVKIVRPTPEQLERRRLAREKRHQGLLAKLTRLKKIQEYSNRPHERLFYAWDPVLQEFRMLPAALIAEDNGVKPRFTETAAILLAGMDLDENRVD